MKGVRGQVIQADVGLKEPKLFVIVSNNGRNGAFDSVLGVRVTTTPPKKPRVTKVELPHGEPVTGWVDCDDIGPIYETEVLRVRGGISPSTLRLIEDGMRAALDL